MWMPTVMMSLDGIVPLVVLLLMLLLIIVIFLWFCKPWRFFFNSSSRSRRPSISAEDLERPLVSDDLDRLESQRDELEQNFDSEESRIQDDGHISSSGDHGIAFKQKIPSTDGHATQGLSVVLDVVSAPSEASLLGQTLKRPLGQTLKRPLVPNRSTEENKSARKQGQGHESKVHFSDDYQELLPENIVYQRSSLTLEVISGPSRGTRCSLQSTDTSRLPLILGRVSPSGLLLKDGEVSGKHAMIKWNLNKLKWELVDMGSLNGTLLNSLSIHNADVGSRHWSEPLELSSGDIITLGTTSKIKVRITHVENEVPFGVGMASEPMALRRGGKKLPMEDVSYYQWPLAGIEKFGLFGICDGHGGSAAAKDASKMLPDTIASILSITENQEKVLTHNDASDILRDAFLQTESSLPHQYEGCTATVLLIWSNNQHQFSLQCANLGDSSCFVNIKGNQIKMTEDHRVTTQLERARLNQSGEPLKDGETRLCGLNIARMLGDKFLKEQESRFSCEPYISEVVCIDEESKAFVVLASDGLWDVISVKKATQIVLEARSSKEESDCAEKIANLILSEARNQRTKDNTSIIFLDFDTCSRTDSL